jgi:uncharacterized membrane protein YdbT with pleckstrin-like domain
MKYSDEVLVGDEKVTYETGLHWIVYTPALVLFVIAIICLPSPYPVAALFFLISSCVSVVRAIIRQMTTEIFVTTKRIIFKRGWISRNTIELNLDRVEGLDINQTISGRVFNFGTVTVRGTGIGSELMRDVKDPIGLRNATFW